MSHVESVAFSTVRAAINIKASMIVVFTSLGRAARLIAKYRPSVPVFAVVIPRLRTNSLKWTFTGSSQARQLLGVRGVYPILASPNVVRFMFSLFSCSLQPIRRVYETCCDQNM